MPKKHPSAPILTKKDADALMATGTKKAPRMYCKRCWTAGIAHQGSRKRRGRCETHHLEIQAETAQQRQRQMEKEQNELHIDDLIFTEIKWLTRQTGVRYAGSDDELYEIVFGTFEELLGSADNLTDENVAAASQAALRAFTKHTGRQPAIAPCPRCQNRNPESRRSNDFNCLQCGWTTPPGTFGAVFIAMSATPRSDDDPERTAVLQQVKTDYGFDDSGWNNVAHTFVDLSIEQLRNILEPTETQLRLTWVTCNDCNEIHENLEPVDRPEYQKALASARTRSTEEPTQ